MSEPNNFDVLKTMSARGMRINMSDQWCHVRKTKRGTQVTVGIGGDFVAVIADGKYLVAMYLIDAEQYFAVHEELANVQPEAAK